MELFHFLGGYNRATPDTCPYLICPCSKFDLYSKSKTRVDVAELKPYYMGLINKVSAERGARGSEAAKFSKSARDR